MTPEGIIGRGNTLPWHIPGDLKVFRQITMGNILLMGRKTFESIGKPLPGRISFVISRSARAAPTPEHLPRSARSGPPSAPYSPANAYYFPSFEDAAAAAAAQPGDLFVIGGASVYRQALPYADCMYLSLIRTNYKGDVYFPAFDMEEWETAERIDYTDFELQVLKRR